MARLEPPFRRLASVLLLPLAVATAACGAGESRNMAMEITEARWTGDTVVVSGTWMKGVSTPPACRLLDGRDGAIVGRFGLEDATFEASTFSQELVPERGLDEAGAGYHVRCSVTLDSAKTASDTAPVEAPG